MDNKIEISNETLFNDYNALIVAYNEVCTNTKTPAEHTLLKITFGSYIEYLNTAYAANAANIKLFYIQLNNTYTKYYMIYTNNIKKCNIANFNKLRDVVCMLLDKYGPPWSDSKKYYLPLAQYLYECKYG